MREFKIGRGSEGETEERVVVGHDCVFGCGISAVEADWLTEEAGGDTAGCNPGPHFGRAGRRGIVALGSPRVATYGSGGWTGGGDYHDTWDGLEEDFEAGEVTGGDGPVHGEQSIFDVDKWECPETGVE